MEHIKILENICSSYDCFMEYVGEGSDVPQEYCGWENSFLIFAPDAKEGEFDLFVIQNFEDAKSLHKDLISQKGKTTSFKKVISDFSNVVFSSN